MAHGFERVGPLIEQNDVAIDLRDAERLRSIGDNVLLSSESTKHITDTSMTASLVVANHLRIPSLRDDNSAALYGYVEQNTYGDNGWQMRLKYHRYGERDGGLLGFESEYAIDVFDDEILFAKRSIYRLRDIKNISVGKNEINIEVLERRTMADTALERVHIDRLEERMRRLVGRAERS